LRSSAAAVFLSIVLGLIAADQPQGAEQKSTQIRPRNEALKTTKTALVEFATSPFPYDGIVPEKDTYFLDVSLGLRRGHRTPRGRILWEDLTYRERRVLLHIPAGYDYTRPGVMVVFFHGHGATLRRDVRDRQLVPAQVSASGINAVLVAPQFAFNASDSSAGKFWEEGGFARFLAEASVKLTELHGSPAAAEAFANMPVVIVAYSGGYLPTAWCLSVGGIEDRLQGIVLLDALYGELDRYLLWMANQKGKFFVSAYTDSTLRKNKLLQNILAEHEMPFYTALNSEKWRTSATFLATKPEVTHEDFVTQAWVENPISDILRRLTEFRR
jgi:hypothetical protein